MKDFPCPLVSPIGENEYAELRKQIQAAGLLQKDPYHFLIVFTVIFSCFVINLIILFSTDTWWIQLINAVFAAFVFGQFLHLEHDAGHQAAFRSKKLNDAFGFFVAFILGASYQSWVEYHNEHHAHTNHEDHDPDIQTSFAAFSQKQAENKPRWAKPIIRFQHVLLYPLMTQLPVAIRLGQFSRVLERRNPRKYLIDFFTLLSHPVCYFTVIFLALPFWTAVMFTVVHQFCWGIYGASCFAPNHKGMPTLTEGQEANFFRKNVLTCRNIKPNPLIDYWYGGLNYQIEHHLFPTLPRRKFRHARKIVKQFCKERDVPYYETSIVRSYWEILKHMRDVSRFA